MQPIKSNATLKIKNKEDSISLIKYISTLIKSVDLEIKIIALETLRNINKKNEIIKDIDLDLMLNCLDDDSNDIKINALKFFASYDPLLLGGSTIMAVLKSIIDLFKRDISYQADYNKKVNYKENMFLTEMIEKYIEYTPENHYEIRDELKWLIIVYLNKQDLIPRSSHFYYDEVDYLKMVYPTSRMCAIKRVTIFLAIDSKF